MKTIQSQTTEIPDPAIVDAIVRKVIERLSELNLDERTSVATSQGLNDESVGNSTQVLELKGRVISLESLRGRLAGTKKVIVQADAVVTPAVHDELRQQGIELQSRSPQATSSTPTQSFCLARLSEHFVPVDWLKKIGLQQVCCADDYGQMSEKLAREQAAGKTICFAAQPYVAVAILNRNNSLRAAFGRTEKEINEIKSTLNANVLVLDSVQPRKQLLALIRCFISQKNSGRQSETLHRGKIV